MFVTFYCDIAAVIYKDHVTFSEVLMLCLYYKHRSESNLFRIPFLTDLFFISSD